jgi:uncharacterized protein (TIGR03086 family)
MTPEHSTATADAVRLVERAFDATGALLGAVPADRWEAQSPCGGWTVRRVGGHLIGSLAIVEAYAREDAAAAAAAEASHDADTGLSGDDLTKAFDEAAERCETALHDFGPLDREVPFVIGSVSGAFLSRVCLLEALVHGWDIARGADMPYGADDAVIEAVWAFAHEHEGPLEQRRAAGFFGPEVPVDADAPVLTRLLAFLGRSA